MSVRENYRDKAPGVAGDPWAAADANAFGHAINAAMVKPTGGIGTTDLSSGVNASLALANSSVQPATLAAAQLVTINAQTDSYTLVLGDLGKDIHINKATAANLTVPANASVALPVGNVNHVTQLGVGQVTVVAAGGVTLLYAGSLKTRTQYSKLLLEKIAVNTWLVGGDSE